MKTLGRRSWSCVLVVLCLAGVGAARDEPRALTYSIEINGELCGYADVTVSNVDGDAGPYQLIEQATVFSASLLGLNVDHTREATADRQLHRFTAASPPPGEFLRSGLWAWCRHPNYLGEILFWWGLFAFSLAAGVISWWTAVGAIAITVMFRLVSLPMIERRMIERRPGYAEHARRTSLLLPRRPAIN